MPSQPQSHCQNSRDTSGDRQGIVPRPPQLYWRDRSFATSRYFPGSPVSVQPAEGRFRARGGLPVVGPSHPPHRHLLLVLGQPRLPHIVQDVGSHLEGEGEARVWLNIRMRPKGFMDPVG